MADSEYHAPSVFQLTLQAEILLTVTSAFLKQMNILMLFISVVFIFTTAVDRNCSATLKRIHIFQYDLLA